LWTLMKQQSYECFDVGANSVREGMRKDLKLNNKG